MQTTTRLIVLFVLSCSLLYTDAKHTLNVDYIVPSATNSVYIPDLETDHLVTTEANIQFIKLHPIPGSSFVVDTLGPITFDASFLDLNSDAFVSLTSGNDFNVQTQESIATNSDELNFDSDRLFMTTTNNFVINTHGSVHGSSLRQHINSLATLDIHTGLGSLALLAGDSLKFGGEYVRFDGDDRVSFYSYNTLSIDALNNFQAYAAFIDFDTYGDVYIESVNGNVEVNSVRELVFLSDEINVSAPIGVELDAEHANAHLNAADTIYIDAADLVYIDVIDEAFFTATGEINAISNADISLTAGNNINVISKYIQYTGSEMNLNTGNTILDTGGDILMRMDAIPGLIVEYDYAALENMEFISSNVIINATFISFESNLGDVDFAALDGVNSVVQFAVRDNFYGYAGETFIIGGSAVGFLSNTFHFEAADASILSSSGVNDLITLSSGDRIDATATNIKGDVEVVSFVATSSIDLNVAPGDYRGTADNEIDESVFLSADNWRINAGGTVSFISTLGDSYIDTTGFLVQANSYDLTSNSDLQIVAITLAANAGTSLTWNLQQANWESQRFDVTSKLTDITLEGEIIQFWASQEGDFTADNKITINTVGDLNFAAYDDIAVSNLISLTSFATLGFEGNRYADFQARNGKLIYDNTPGEWYMSSDDNQDITWSGNFAKITATDKINLDSGFTTFAASGNLITFATDFTIDTTLQENVNLRYTDIIEVANTAPNFAVSSGNILIDVDGVNRIISEGVLSVSAASGVDINLLHPVVFHAAKNLAATASNDVLIASTGEFDSVSVDGDTTFNFNRFWKAHLEGALTFQASAGMSVDGGNDITVIQDPGVAQSVYTTISTTNYKTTLTESYTQNGGSTVLTTGQYDILSTNRILLGSFSESVFTLSTGSGVLYDASPANSNVVLTSSDLDVHTSGAVTFTGGNVLVSSDNSEYIEFEGQTLVSLTSLSDRIKWTAVYDWNVTAVAGLRYTANGKNTADNAAIKIQNNADTFSDVNFLVRDGTTTLTSNDTQTWDADRIVLRAASDIYYKNPFAGGVSGGVLFDSQGSEHDGIYGDQAGISVRTTNANSWIWFNITLGEANINSGYDLHQIVTDSQSRFYSDNEISFLAEAGDVDIGSAGGSVVFQSTQRNVVWTTNKSTELQASGIIDTLAGKEINLFSNGPVTKFPQHDYKLGFEFSAEAGSILTQANTGFPIHFQALNFDTLSGENTHFQASDAIPIVTQNGHFYSTGETGLYYSVENGDLDLTASVNISVTSAKNEDIRVVSGLDSTWTASSKNFTSLAGIDTIIRTERNSATFRTFDSLGNIAISGGGIVEFQSDGTSDSVGGVNVDGIFLDAPNINSYSQDITTTEAEVLYTVGLQTRPIVNLIGGGDASFRGVQFTAEGNINQDIGQNFLINSQGSVLVNTDKDLDYLATGAVSIVSLGTNPVGKNVRFVTDGELDVSAANIQINANRRITFYADDLLSWKVTGTNPTNSYISIDVVDDLRSYVANIMDFNAADWAWTATDSFNLVTLGNVEFVNNPTGTISIYGDTNLEFVSDVNMLLETTGPNADLSLTTQLSNSNLVIQTWYQSSDILFKAVGNFVASSVNEATIDAHGPIQITAPYDDVGSATLSTIDFNSADDFSVLAAGGLTLKANDGLTLQATGVDSDFEVDSDGALNIFAWQNGVFSSVHDSLSFVTAYNFTFANQPNHGGDVVFQSTRDIIQNYGQDLYIETGDDQTYTATRTFLFNLQTAGTSYLDITTVKEDADITIAALQGPVLIHTYDNINLIGGDTYFVATTTATMTVDTLTLTTSGIHDRVQFDAKNVLNLNGGDITFATDTSTTNGLAFQDFLATGKNSAGGYSLKFTSVSNTNILASEGGVSFWADTSITSTSKTLSFVADNFFPLAGYGLAVAAADGTLNVRAHDLVVDSNANEIVSLFRDQIVLYPFETSTLEGKGASEDYEDIGLLLQSNHESSDIRIFSTDFLTADLQFRGNSLNLYAEESITMLLLDDDDTQFVGTYLWQSIGGSINVAAENEIYVQETSTGDIVFTGSGTQYFTAGDMFTITTREQLLFEANTWDVASTGSFTVNYASLDATLGSQFVVQATDALILDVEADFNVGTVNGVIQVGSGSLGEDEDTEPFLILNSNDVTTFATGGAAGNQVFITVNDGVAVDFRDGLKIPFRNAGGIVPGATACAGNAFGGPSSLFYETNSGLLCYCDTNTLQCVQTFPVTII